MALTISVTVYPAPSSRHTVRKPRSVTPAMGAKASFEFMVILPIFTVSPNVL